MKPHNEICRLALKARAGDRDALSCLVDALRAGLFTKALAYSRNFADAQDAVANALVEVCLHIGELREPGGVSAWMTRIVRREALRIRRRPAPVDLTGNEADSRVDVIRSVIRMDVEHALHRLPGNHAAAVHMFYLEATSIKDIAA